MKTINFTKRYVLALTIIALLSALAYFNLNKLLSVQSNDARLINMSTNQKLLTREIAFYAIYYKIERLKANIFRLEEGHKELTSLLLSKELSKIYYGKEIWLDNQVKKYLYHAKRFYKNRDGQSQNYVLKNSQKLLNALDKAVIIYLKEANAHTEKLKKVEFLILVMTLTTLLFEAIFIFMPANLSIKLKTRELIREKDYSNAVIESSSNAIITLDRKLKIRTFNKKAETIFGYTKHEMLNQSSLKNIIPTKLDGDESEKEIEALNKEGKKFPIRISFGRSGESRELAIVVSIQDISTEKLNDKILQQQSKLAALGEMIAIIAHQWRQPLTQLNFNCMYIKKRMKDPELVKEAKKNQEIIQFMSETITNFENFYKKTKSSEFNPDTSIKQALKIIDSTLNLNQIEVLQDIDSQAKIYGNANSLSHVVLSIIQNSNDVIKIRKPQNPKIHITLKSKKEYITIEITDNAGGIKVEPIEDIFKPFTSKKKTPSTGIGLYMSKLVIQNQFKGNIEAKNINNGAQFIITLPL